MSPKDLTTQSSNFEKLLRSAMELPGIRINRAKFLEKTLSKHYSADIVAKAIGLNPAQAGISAKELERFAKSSITYETSKVAGLSAAAGIPGFKAMAVTVPADLLQFFGHILRILQKLAYIYGWQEMFKNSEDDELDDGLSNQLTLFVGVMFGVNAANAALSKIANLAAQGIPKHLMRQALTHGTLYPIIKTVFKAVGVKMTKPVFSQAVGKAIPVVGAVVSGGITFALFKPMSNKLKKHLITLPIASVDFYDNPTDSDLTDGKDVIDVDFSDVVIEDVDGLEEKDVLEEAGALEETDERTYAQ